MNSPKRIGFVGLGMMGAPMVQRLVGAGYEVFVADADPARIGELTRHLKAGELQPEIISSLDALITMLPNSGIVESVLLDASHGFASRLRPGAVVIDMSSSEPARSALLGMKLDGMGLSYLDAPVSGGVRRARDGTLAILVGGRSEVLERCRELLKAMGTSLLHIGAAGSGHAAKALNNYVSAAGILATVEALHVAARFGVAPEVMTDVLNASSGKSNTSENKVKQFMLNGSFASGFALQLMNKDLKIAIALAREMGYPMRLGETTVEVWNEASERSTPSTDHTEMYRLMPGHDD